MYRTKQKTFGQDSRQGCLLSPKGTGKEGTPHESGASIALRTGSSIFP